jgi:hypothetical protein
MDGATVRLTKFVTPRQHRKPLPWLPGLVMRVGGQGDNIRIELEASGELAELLLRLGLANSDCAVDRLTAKAQTRLS